jgi:hypothetical protein
MMVLGAEPIQTVPRQVLDADLDFNINTNITVKPQHDNAWPPCGLHGPGHNAACTRGVRPSPLQPGLVIM